MKKVSPTTVLFRGSTCDTTFHLCDIFNMEVSDISNRPIGKVLSPFGLKIDYLRVEYRGTQWICNLD
jgi:hypothetical protein